MAENHEIDWQRVKELDEKYYMHVCKSEMEYTHIPSPGQKGTTCISPMGRSCWTSAVS